MHKKLYRSRTNSVLLGVCGCLAEYFEVDATLIRVLWIIGTILTGIFAGVIAYIVVALVIPVAPEIVREEVSEA